MEWVDIRLKVTEFIKKYRYVAIVLLAGLFLMLLPEGDTTQEEILQPQAETVPDSPVSLQDSLSEILSKIEGAGKVQVLLSQAAGEQTIYQTDEDLSSGETGSDIRRETVIISGSDRAESGLVQQVNPPVYLGAIVLCQGADSAAVRLAIVEAVANATGLTTDKISVLKMK